MKLSIVIVNYNVQYFLENCLLSVKNATKDLNAEVFVVDNNSVDGSVQMVREKFPEVKLIDNKENLGFSKANNQAIKMAKGEYVLLLNPDTVIEEDTLTKCCNYMDANSKVGGLGIRMIDGKGNFLPESKRGLPTPSVAFYKIFGLSNLFPKSKRFGQYHLGHLSKEENHSIEILSGAFMLLRKKVLDEIGLLDESFFMYGEDIDLSYRIIKAGYENHYFADSSIIHYKGESTKKSSINYVFVFYNAMIIFAKKHFSDKNAKAFSILINLAIYLRAILAIITRTIKNILLPLSDSIVLFAGVYTFKNYYEDEVKFVEGGSYPKEVELYGIPIILIIYIVSFFFSRAYYIPTRFTSILKGAFLGSLLLLISYSLLEEAYRFSRAIVLFTVIWSCISIPLYRMIFNRIGLRTLAKEVKPRIAIIGERNELERISKFLKDTLIQPEAIVYINPTSGSNEFNYTGKINQLSDIVQIYEINEIIFCSKDIDFKTIIEKMAEIEHLDVDFKIAPPESLYIIGSNSIENSGEYYIIGANAILKPVNQQNKRVLDICLSILFLILSPLLLLINAFRLSLYQNLFRVLFGNISFVSFYNSDELKSENLKIKKGILNPSDGISNSAITSDTIEQLNIEYGRDYSLVKDIEIIFRNLHNLCRVN